MAEIPRMPKLLFVGEVAAMLRRSPDQLRYMMSQGTAPKHAKIGGRVMFKESDVESYIEDAYREAS